MGRYSCNNLQEESSHFPVKNHDDASSEMIGSIILIGVFVAAFGVVLVMLLSAPSAFVVPAVSIDARIIEDDDTYVLDLRAGDTLQRNETRILVDGRDVTANFTSTMGGSDWDQWGSGDSLTLDLTGNEPPESVQIIYYDPNGGGILLWDVGTSATVIPPTGLTPVAAFSANVTGGMAPLTVQFTDASSNDPYAWQWSFGDGGSSSAQHPVHIYTSPGVYTIQLTAYNPDGSGSAVKTGYIQVFAIEPLFPVAWWRFDEASGSTAVDSSGNGNDGIIEGGPADRRAGACGTGLYFDGTTTWVSVPDDDTLSFNDTFTFAGWFKPEVPEYVSAPDSYRNYTQIIGKGYDDYQRSKYSNNYEVFLKIDNDALRFEENGELDAVNAEGAISDVTGLPLSYDEWFHIAVVVDGGTGTVYVDGQEEGTFSVTRTPLQENTEPVSIGRQMVTKYDWANFFYKGMMDELYLYGTALTADEVATLADACSPPSGDAPVVSFTGTPVTGDAPLAVQFTSTVTGTTPFTYLWSFGDGTTSSDLNPLHTYTDAGTYDVNLTVTNGYGTDTLERTAYINATEGVSAFAQYVVNENVFVYGQELSFAGDAVTGPGATIHITGSELNTADLNGGTSLAVSNINVDGTISLDGGSAALGSEVSPGSIYVNGDLYLGIGARDIYGDVYVNGNCYLKDPVIHGTMYVDGELGLGWTPDLTDANIFYTGKFSHPPHMDRSILDKCSKLKSVPGFTIPAVEMPSARSDAWYSSRGYVSGGALADNIRICADSYTAVNDWPAPSTAEDVIIVAKSGDIRLTGMGNRIVTGVLFAPNGEVVFEGSLFEGLVIAQDGFRVTSGGTAVTFKNMNEYISDPADYPF
ncbi:PKD domain-containing protein [Methanogenium sp. S4BF]|uniref:PKD domain-containing protein n=1 Tax=Methanogenium sp. S4BF TaxID=1789226 RepID=UPI002415D942|nr:PKD domain-containing protein [Methanogenium sp. S4BF]WFN35412.1 PKD domain-containing protein [Methanogenium sp. S4BF]